MYEQLQQSKAPPLEKPSERAPAINGQVEPIPSAKPIPSVKPIPHKASPPVIRKDVPIKPKEIIPGKPDNPIETAQTAPTAAPPIQPKEKLVDILIRKYPVTRETHPELERSPKFQEWINAIKVVNDDPMLTHDLETMMKTRPRFRMTPPISDGALASEARFTLHCLESGGYIRITETPFRVQHAPDRIIYNEQFEFLPGKLNEFNEGV